MFLKIKLRSVFWKQKALVLGNIVVLILGNILPKQRFLLEDQDIVITIKVEHIIWCINKIDV